MDNEEKKKELIKKIEELTIIHDKMPSQGEVAEYRVKHEFDLPLSTLSVSPKTGAVYSDQGAARIMLFTDQLGVPSFDGLITREILNSINLKTDVFSKVVTPLIAVGREAYLSTSYYKTPNTVRVRFISSGEQLNKSHNTSMLLRADDFLSFLFKLDKIVSTKDDFCIKDLSQVKRCGSCNVIKGYSEFSRVTVTYNSHVKNLQPFSYCKECVSGMNKERFGRSELSDEERHEITRKFWVESELKDSRYSVFKSIAQYKHQLKQLSEQKE